MSSDERSESESAFSELVETLAAKDPKMRVKGIVRERSELDLYSLKRCPFLERDSIYEQRLTETEIAKWRKISASTHEPDLSEEEQSKMKEHTLSGLRMLEKELDSTDWMFQKL